MNEKKNTSEGTFYYYEMSRAMFGNTNTKVRDKNTKFVEFEEIIMHENYNSTVFTNDIALIKVKEDINFTIAKNKFTGECPNTFDRKAYYTVKVNSF